MTVHSTMCSRVRTKRERVFIDERGKQWLTDRHDAHGRTIHECSCGGVDVSLERILLPAPEALMNESSQRG